MWKEYSSSYIKSNRGSRISVIVASLIATLFLSLICSLFFNFWTYEIDGIIAEEGNWHGRLIASTDTMDIATIQNFPNVESAIINSGLSDEQKVTVDIVFHNPKTTYEDMPLIAERMGLDASAVSYHTVLLANYLIHDPNDATPPMLLLYYIFIVVIVSISLIMIIHNAFAVSMNARVHQFGIFSSVGATPSQIRTCLLQEALALSSISIVVGTVLGIAISAGVVQVTNMVAADVSGRHMAVFRYHPLVLVITLLAAFLTVLFSTYIPAKKLSKATPIEAIKNTNGLHLKKKKKSYILSLLFGIEGELAGNALKAQKKSLRTATRSLTLSFLAFTIMLCFFTLSGISTNHTYFERYQDVWDVMVTVKNTGIAEFEMTEELQANKELGNITVYQKAVAVSLLSNNLQSDELKALGGLGAVAGSSVTSVENGYLVKVPLVIMDDMSFSEYCMQIDVIPNMNGVIVLNRIWDNINSNFRYKEYVPFVNESQKVISIQNRDNAERSVDVDVIAYTQEVPVLREEYDNYALVQFISLSMWENIAGTIGNAEADTYVRVLADAELSLEEANVLDASVVNLIGKEYGVESENRIQEKVSNDEMLDGFMMIIGAFCILLATIGIANVFSNTLGFIQQRKREFVQYMSIGMTEDNIRKMFSIEALVIAGRPLFITLPLTVVFVGFMITASYLDPMEFLVEAPVLEISLFIFLIFVFVGLAYYLGGKRILKSDIAETLRNDTLV
jgi:putative ABC transport system permease protein